VSGEKKGQDEDDGEEDVTHWAAFLAAIGTHIPK